MSRIFTPHTNFTAGQFSKKLYGRSDIAKYPNAAKVIKNFKVLPQGALIRRSGTRYIAEVKDSTKQVRLIPFTHSTETSYVLEFGNQYFRVFKNESQVDIVTGADLVSNGAFPSDLASWVDVSGGTGSSVWNAGAYADLLGTSSVNFGGLEQNLTVTTLKRYLVTFDVVSGTVDVRVGKTSRGQELQNDLTYTTGTGKQLFFTAVGTTAVVGFASDVGGAFDNVVVKEIIPVEVATPFLDTDLFEIDYDQSADVLYLVHPLKGRKKIERTSDTAWTINDWTESDGPYLKENVTPTTMTPAAVSGTNVAVTASVATFTSDDVGRMLRIKIAGVWGTGKIITFNSTTSVQVDIDTTNDRYGPAITTTYGGTAASAAWRLSPWSTLLGFPRTITISKGRMTLGGSISRPNEIWMSESDDFESFRPTTRDGSVNDSQGMSRTLDSGQVNSIKWLASLKELFFGTSNNVFKVSGGQTSSIITPKTIQVDRVNASSSAFVKPAILSDSLLFSSRSKLKVRELAFRFDQDAFKTPDMTLLSDDITKSGIVEMSVAEEPDPIIYSCLQDGGLRGLSFKRTQDVVAWFQTVLGGNTPNVKSITIVPSANQDEDTLYCAVSRVVNGVTKIFVEFQEGDYLPDSSTDTNKAYFVDAGVSYKGKQTTVISGLKHLEGETVQVLGDGAVLPDQVVSSDGSITISTKSSEVHVGLGYISEVTTLDLKTADVPSGTLKSRIKRVVAVLIRLVDTIGGKSGVDVNTLDVWPTRDDVIPMDSGPPLFDGIRELTIRGGKWDRETNLTVIQDQPLPMTILGFVYEVEVL